MNSKTEAHLSLWEHVLQVPLSGHTWGALCSVRPTAMCAHSEEWGFLLREPQPGGVSVVTQGYSRAARITEGARLGSRGTPEAWLGVCHKASADQ